MTRLPHDNWDVHGVQGPHYRVGPHCAVANCPRWAEDPHHIWRRSAIAGDFKWVRLWDGTVVQNICALCAQHHRAITDGRATIVYRDDMEPLAPVFFHADTDDMTVLVPQPKTLAEFTALNEDVVDRDHEEPPCPTCGHRPRRRSEELPPGARRNRASWNVSVPKDERENGAAVLDELELAAAEKLGRADHRSHKYFTLVEVLASFVLGNIETPADLLDRPS